MGDGSLLKDELDLNDLFRPLTFLNSLCQLTARQAHCPMDVLNLVSAWSKSSIVSPTLVIIKSLIMQGAEMNGTQLKETSRDAPEIVPLPPLVIGYSKVAELGDPHLEAHSSSDVRCIKAIRTWS